MEEALRRICTRDAGPQIVAADRGLSYLFPKLSTRAQWSYEYSNIRLMIIYNLGLEKAVVLSQVTVICNNTRGRRRLTGRRGWRE